MFSSRNKEKLSLNYPQYPRLSGALISGVTGLLHNRIIGWILTPNIQEYLSLSRDRPKPELLGMDFLLCVRFQLTAVADIMIQRQCPYPFNHRDPPF